MTFKYTFIIIIILTIAFYACRTIRDQWTLSGTMPQATYLPLRPDLSSSIPPCPSDKAFSWVMPDIHLETVTMPDFPKVEITDSFCHRDINHVRVTDAKIFACTDKIFIDLQRLRNDAYSFPLPGARLLSPFGGKRKNHAGVDLKTFANDTIRAVFDGIVRMAKEYEGYGNVIVIRHYNGLETVYSHNSKHLVAQGMRVRTGQSIALVGRTGRATTEHLHFETRINGRSFNPALLFDMETEQLHDNVLMCTMKNNKVEVVSIQHISPAMTYM